MTEIKSKNAFQCRQCLREQLSKSKQKAEKHRNLLSQKDA